MTNRFEKYDQPQKANRFAKYDEEQPAPAGPGGPEGGSAFGPGDYMPKLPQTDTFSGLAAQGATGVGMGVAMVPGLLRDLPQLELMGLDYLGGVKEPTPFPSSIPLPTGAMMQAVAGDIAHRVGIPMAGEPKTALERGARGTGEFIGSNVALGGLNMASVARGAGAGLLSEGARETFPDDPLAPVIAAFVGGGLPSKAATMLPGAQMSAETLALAQKLKALGVDLTPAQLGGPVSKMMHSAASAFPFMVKGREEGQLKQFNSALAREMGTQADNLGPDVMRATRKRIGDQFDTILSRNVVPLDQTLKQDLDAILNTAGANLGVNGLSDVERALNNIKTSAARNNGVMPGRQYHNLTREGGALRGLIKNVDENVRFYGSQVRDVMDKALERAAVAAGNANDVQALRTAKKQWRVMKQVEPLAAKAVEGQVNPALLLGRVAATDKQLPFDKGNLATLARGGASFLKPPRSSGTAERQLGIDLLKTVGGLGAAGAGGMLTTGAVVPALAGAVALGGAAQGTKSLLEAKWLANLQKAGGAVKNSKTGRMLFRPGGNPALRKYGVPAQQEIIDILAAPPPEKKNNRRRMLIKEDR